MNTMSLKGKIKLEEVKGLEVHRYAPELNQLVMGNGKRFKCPRRFDVPSAIDYVNKRIKDGKISR